MLDVCLGIFELNKLSINMSLIGSIIATNIIYYLRNHRESLRNV